MLFKYKLDHCTKLYLRVSSKGIQSTAENTPNLRPNSPAVEMPNLRPNSPAIEMLNLRPNLRPENTPNSQQSSSFDQPPDNLLDRPPDRLSNRPELISDVISSNAGSNDSAAANVTNNESDNEVLPTQELRNTKRSSETTLTGDRTRTRSGRLVKKPELFQHPHCKS